MGGLLKRLVSRCCAVRLQDKAAAFLAPHQLGVGVRGGSEAIVHTVRKVLEADPTLLCLQADLVNCFNLLDREVGMEEVAAHFPEILAWTKTCYGKPSHLMFGDFLISSERGWHQGDPLAALLCCLVLLPLIKKIKEKVPDLKVQAWFLDDGTFVGREEDLVKVVDLLAEEGPARGLVLSTTITSPSSPKTTVWSPQGEVELCEELATRGVVAVEAEGVVLLGAPLGSQEFMEEEVERKVQKVKEVSLLLALLQDPHIEFVLQRACSGMPKFSYLLRTVDTTTMVHLLEEFDRNTRDSLARILGAAIGDRTWEQSKLPVSKGGMGLRGAEDHAPVAFAASVLASQPLLQGLLGVNQLPGEEPLPVLAPHLLAAITTTTGGEAREEELVGVPQKELSFKVDEERRRRLMEEVGEEEVEERARLLSLTLPQAGAWLNVAPIFALGLHMRPQEFVLAARYRLGMAVFTHAGPCPACRQYSDEHGRHAMNCGGSGERIGRHHLLRNHIHEMAVSAGLGPTKEARFLIPGEDSRPADVLIPQWAAGLDAAIDVTVVNPLQRATVERAATTAGYATTFAFQRKMRGAGEACTRQGISLMPVVVESLGGWGEEAVRVVRRLAGALARHTGQDEDEVLKFQFGKIANSLQRGNSTILAARMPGYPTPATDGQI